jgi:transcription elongation factor GreB
MSETKPITPAGYDRLNKELNDLWRRERPKVVQEVSEAAAHGDRSENAEYKYGKRRLREIDRRMRYLSGLLDKLKVIDPSSISSDRVQFGATVRIIDAEERERTYQIVGVEEVDVKAGKISIASPMGRALLNKRVGDIAVINRPAGDLDVEIVELRYV